MEEAKRLFVHWLCMTFHSSHAERMEKGMLEQDLSSSCPFYPSSREDGFHPNMQVKEKKFRLFGFDVDPCANKGQCMAECEKGAETATSLQMGSFGREEHVKEKSPTNSASKMKHECCFCGKKFTNSQALGGHQNAHKKERLKRRRLQLETRNATMKFYHQWFRYPSWYYNLSCCIPDSKQNKETQTSFNSVYHKAFINDCHDLASYRVWVPSQGFVDTFNMTDAVKYDRHTPQVIRPSASPVSMHDCEMLDFQLGLVGRQ